MKNVEEIYPLSPLQQGILYHTLHEQEFSMYFEIITWVIEGEVDFAAYEQAWQRAVDLHPVLRSSFVWEGVDEPLQVVRRRARLPMTHLDWRGLSGGEQDERLSEFFKEERRRGFDLMKPPLMRVTLIRTGEATYRFVWCYHHGLVDGWSCSLIFNDVFAAYEALRRGAEPRLAAPRPFADYIDWVRGQDMAAAEAYWRRALKGFTAPTPLGFDAGGAARREGEEAATKSYREQALSLPADVSGALTRLARGRQLTLNTLCLGAWAILLSRYSGERDVVCGVAVSGRPPTLPGVETMVGMLVNTLPARISVEPERPLLPWLDEIQRGQVELRQYEYSPLVSVHGWSDVPRNTPLFETVLSFENHPVDYSLLGRDQRARLHDVVHHHTATGIPVNLTIEPGEQLLIKIFYDFGRLGDAAVGRMLGHLARLLEGIAADPHRRLSELSPLSEEERGLLLSKLSRGPRVEPRAQLLQEMFEAQAARTPERVALVAGGARYTYGQLNGRAGRLARRLRASGVGAEVPVAVCAERSAEMVAALLGILKAGGGYLPLDTAYPRERLAFMLEDARPRVLLTERRLLERLPPEAVEGAEVYCLDEGADGWEPEAAPGVEVGTTADNLAYFIYTSGSTGRPKGVAITHRSAVVFLEWARSVFGDEQLEGVLASTSISFDLSVFELFAPLSWGGKVILAENALQLPALDAAGEVTLVNTVPSAMTELVRMKGLPDSVRTVNLAGEALPRRLVRQLYELGHVEQVFNLYGPSEDTTYSTFTPVSPEGEDAPHIGRPVGNTHVYVLGAGLEPSPVGVAGELYIGGAGLARGYHKRPALTAERFVPDPYSAEPGARMYRTGDLAGWREDGALDFLGRRDHQIKLRGFRIELGEIEAALRAHRLVREAVVLAREDAPGEKRLVAYLACDDEAAVSQGDWRVFLRRQLPEFMIPAAFVCLPQLPLTPNGKVDRRALPAPEFRRDESVPALLTPRTPIEAGLLDIWRDLLRVVRPTMDDNFFDLGGHSLLATQVISRVRDLFGIDVPVRALFEEPTLAGLASFVEARLSDGGRVAAPPLRPSPRDTPPPLSFAQQRLWFMDQLEPGDPRYNLTHAFHLRGPLDVAALERSIEEIVRRHETLRTTFAFVGRAPAQVVHEEASVKPTLVDLGHLPAGEREAEARRLADEQALRRFDLARGPLLHVTLMRLGDEEHVVVLTMHHIISDGWSLGVWVSEVASCYDSFGRGLTPSLPPLPVQYADFARWQRAFVESGALGEQLEYWKRQLGGELPALKLPSDYERPARPSFGGATLDFELPAALYEELRKLSRRQGCTLFMTLLAAFESLLHAYTGQTDMLVGTDVANRNRLETEHLIGFFVNMLPLRTDLSGDPTFRELLGRVRETALEAYAHQDVPFDTLVNALRVERQGRLNPLFQTVFVLQNAPLGTLRLTGLTVTDFEVPSRLAHLDLVCSLWEADGRLYGALHYSTELFEEETVTRLLSRYRELLEAVAADPSKRLSELRGSEETSGEAYTLRNFEVKLSREQLASLLQDSNEP